MVLYLGGRKYYKKLFNVNKLYVSVKIVKLKLSTDICLNQYCVSVENL